MDLTLKLNKHENDGGQAIEYFESLSIFNLSSMYECTKIEVSLINPISVETKNLEWMNLTSLSDKGVALSYRQLGDKQCQFMFIPMSNVCSITPVITEEKE